MGKLIKYELKGKYKLFLGLFAIVSLLNILILTRINKWSSPAVVSLMIMVTVILFVMILVFVVNSFRNELYNDRAYLTFTLPVSGNKILISKIIIAIIWFIIGSIITFIFFKILLDNELKVDTLKQISLYFNTTSIFVVGAIFSIVNLVMLLLMIYFSITLTRVALKGKRMSKFLGFITFIALNFLIYYIEYKIIKVFPQTFELKLKFLTDSGIAQMHGELVQMDGNAIEAINEALKINTAAIIYNIIVYVGLFLSTGYLIEKKIDV